MGAWGEGLYENDAALDCLGDTVEEFEEAIDEWFESWDGGDSSYTRAIEGYVGPLINLLRVLCEQSPATPPGEEKVEKWRARFFEAFDANAAEGWGAESAKVRRGLFEGEFEKLLGASRRAEESEA